MQPKPTLLRSDSRSGWIVNRPTSPDLPVRWEPLPSGIGFRAHVDSAHVDVSGAGRTLSDAMRAMLAELRAQTEARVAALERAGYLGGRLVR